MIKKISMDFDSKQLELDLQRYAKLALDTGATDAAVISASQITVDERVHMKCRFPLCSEYGACMNCPPNTGTIDEIRNRLAMYEYAIVVKLEVPSENIAGVAARGDVGVEDLKKIVKIVSTVESAAFYDGYYFAAGFSSASCHFIWCAGLDCQALSGKGCRYRARAYASMEAIGIDVFRLAASLGWDVYPIGMSADPDMFQCGSRFGMILIR